MAARPRATRATAPCPSHAAGPRGAKRSGAKPEVKSEVKSEVKPEDSKAPKAGGKRARGGQPGPRGANGAPATYAKMPNEGPVYARLPRLQL